MMCVVGVRVSERERGRERERAERLSRGYLAFSLDRRVLFFCRDERYSDDKDAPTTHHGSAARLLRSSPTLSNDFFKTTFLRPSS